MFDRSKAWAVALLAAVFVAGLATGWAGASWTRHRGRERRPRGTEAMLTYLDRELKLTRPQHDSVRAVLQRRRSEIRTLWQEVHPRLDSLRQAMHAEIEAQLDADRRARYLQLLARREHRQRRKRTSADTGRRN